MKVTCYKTLHVASALDRLFRNTSAKENGHERSGRACHKSCSLKTVARLFIKHLRFTASAGCQKEGVWLWIVREFFQEFEN